MKRFFSLLFLLAGVSLAGCSLPGRAFLGGPSPWLPGGAPGGVYAPNRTTQPAPASATRQRAKKGGGK